MTCYAQGVAITSGTVSGASDKVEDAAETAGGTGAWILGVRRDTQASSATTTGDNATLNLDATGNLWISGTVLEDVAEVAGGTGHVILSVRRDAAASSAGASGDYATLNTDANGRLFVIEQNSADALTALQLIDNAVSGAGFNITQLGGAAVPIGAGLEATAIRVTLPTNGTGLVTVTDGAGALNTIVDSGTLTAVTTITNAVTVTDGAGALNTIIDSGTVTANAGTGTFVVGDGAGALNVINAPAPSVTVTALVI